MAPAVIGPHKPKPGTATGHRKLGMIVYTCAGRDAYGRTGCAKHVFDHPPRHTAPAKAAKPAKRR